MRSWSTKELDMLRRLSALGYSDACIANKMRRTAHSVRNKRFLECIPKAEKKAEYVAYIDGEVVGVGTLQELSDLTGRSESTLQRRASRSGRKSAGVRGVKLYKVDNCKEEEFK